MRALVVLMILGACTESGTPPLVPDAAPLRFLRPPSDKVHAYPPHAIRSDGVGPYLLDAPLGDVLDSLPEGPRIELLQIGRFANWRVVRAEAGQLLIGADAANRVAFIAVLAPGVARTQTGVGVGATGAELVKALGVERDAGDLTRDRRVYEFAALPGVRFITDASGAAPGDDGRVVAVVLLRSDLRYERSSTDGARPPVPTPAPRPAAGRHAVHPAVHPDAGVPRDDEGERHAACRAGGALAGAEADIIALARGRARPGPPAIAPVVRYGCFTGPAPEAAVLTGAEVVLVVGEPGKLRRLAALPVAPASFLAAIDMEGDGHDELLLGGRRREGKDVWFGLQVLRWEAGHLALAMDERAFPVGTEAAAAAAGVTPEQVDLAVEVRPDNGALFVAGLYLARRDGAVRELAPLQPLMLRVDSRRPVEGRPVPEPPEPRPSETDKQPDATAPTSQPEEHTP